MALGTDLPGTVREQTLKKQHTYPHKGSGITWSGLSGGETTAPSEAQFIYYIQLNREVRLLYQLNKD